jgi:hypothetical protein
MPTATAPAPAPSNIVGFNYGFLDDRQRAAVESQAKAIHRLHARMATDAVEIGKRLLTVREQLPTGQFNSWIRAEFGWVQSTASNLILIAQRFGDLGDCLERFEPSALYALGRAKVSNEARAEAIDLARAGRVVTHLEATSIIQRHDPQPALPVPKDDVYRLKSTMVRIARGWPEDDRARFAELLIGMVREILSIHAPECVGDAEAVGLVAPL